MVAPGAEGYLGVMANHAALMTQLGIGPAGTSAAPTESATRSRSPAAFSKYWRTRPPCWPIRRSAPARSTRSAPAGPCSGHKIGSRHVMKHRHRKELSRYQESDEPAQRRRITIRGPQLAMKKKLILTLSLLTLAARVSAYTIPYESWMGIYIGERKGGLHLPQDGRIPEQDGVKGYR